MKIDGACHCGNITYEAEVDPEKMAVCHCSDCQTLSGTAFRTIVFTQESDFKLKSGELKTYVKIADSGRQRAQTFCPDCGTPIYAGRIGDEGPPVYGLRVGAIKQRDQFRPFRQVWCRSAHDWTDSLGAVEKVETQ